MRHRLPAGREAIVALLAGCASLVWGCLAAAAAEEGGTAGAATPAKRLPAADVFDRHRLWEAHIRISAEAWKRMQPSQTARVVTQVQARIVDQPGFLNSLVRAFAGGPGPATRPGMPGTHASAPVTRPAISATQPAIRDYETRLPSYYGKEYDYVRGKLEFNGEVFDDVGIRFKGASSYDTAAQSLKRPFKIDFNRFVDGQLFHGVQQINLQNNACDPSQIRDAVSYWAFREAGIPAPRTAFVLLYLTIEGEREHVCLGVYTMVEEVDKRFLKSRFGSKTGLLVKPEAGQLPYLGANWSQYRAYQPRSKGTAEETSRMMELARIIHQETGRAFREKIEKLMDVDEFLQFMAVNVMIANLDSILGIDHNFYLYVPPRQGKITWVPWDLNLTWGAYQRMGGWDELMELSVRKPWSGQKPLLDKVLAENDWRQAYVEHLRRLRRTALSEEKVEAEILAMEMAVRDADCRGGGVITAGNPADLPWTPSWKEPLSPAEFARGRWRSLGDQLDDKPAGEGCGGYVPRFRIGGLHEGIRYRAAAPPATGAAAFAAMDTDGDGKLSRSELAAGILGVLFAKADREGKSAIDMADVVAALEVLKLQPKQIGPVRSPAGQESPQTKLARKILYEADRDLDGRITKAELRATIRRLLYEYDVDGDGQLSRQEFANIVARFLAGL